MDRLTQQLQTSTAIYANGGVFWERGGMQQKLWMNKIFSMVATTIFL